MALDRTHAFHSGASKPAFMGKRRAAVLSVGSEGGVPETKDQILVSSWYPGVVIALTVVIGAASIHVVRSITKSAEPIGISSRSAI